MERPVIRAVDRPRTASYTPAMQKGVILLDRGCRFVVWAPHAEEVFVVGTFNDWNDTAHPMQEGEEGVWQVEIPEAKAGDEYRYRIVTGGKAYSRTDPYARRLTHSAGNGIIQKDIPGRKPGRFEPAPLHEMVIYELHVGTFGKTGSEPGPGDLEGAIERLDHLHELGVNAVEIMPVTEFPGAQSWGYNPSHIFAIGSDYGKPVTFRDFVRKAHDLGIAVIVDVVYNHLGPSDLDIWRFDGWFEHEGGGIYFYNDERAETPWGHTRPDYGRREVREYLRDNALMWIQDYGVDGLRWDATAYMRNVKGGDGDPGDLPEGWSLMQWINEELKHVRPSVLNIAEDLQNNPLLTKAPADGGAGFDTQWDARFVHPVRAALLEQDDAKRDMNAVRDAILHRFHLNAFERVIYTESHDEVANGKARVPEEIDPGHAASWAARKRSTLGAAVVFSSPGVPMLFQGQEFLEDDWFHDEDPLDWSKKERYHGIFKLYADLIALRRNRDGHTRGLCGQEVSVHHVNNDDKVLAWHRWDKGGPGDSVVIVANFSAHPKQGYRIGLPAEGRWVVRFNSDSRFYDQEFSDIGPAEVQATGTDRDGLPAEAALDIAPYSALILSQE